MIVNTGLRQLSVYANQGLTQRNGIR